MDNIERRQAERFQFLKLLYDKRNHFYEYKAQTGSEVFTADDKELGAALGFSIGQLSQITDYLQGKGLIKRLTGKDVLITARGIDEVESTLSGGQTKYFQVVQNIIHANQITNSPIQQGTLNSAQTASYSSESLQDLHELLQQLKAALQEVPLDHDNKAEAEAEIATIESQLSSPRPKSNIIASSLSTIKGILKGVPQNVIANLVAAQISIPELIDHISGLLEVFK